MRLKCKNMAQLPEFSPKRIPPKMPNEEPCICGYPVDSKEADELCKRIMRAIVSKNPNTIWLHERYEALKVLDSD